MSIRAWSEDYASGYTIIDNQHKTLFRMINVFAEKNDESVSTHALVRFIDGLLEYCEKHFRLEEEMMKENNYPLEGYHTDIHNELKRIVITVKRQVIDNVLREPYTTIVNLATDWLNNHIAQDDLAIFNFCKNKDYVLSDNFLGRKCEVTTMDNRIIGTGKINFIENNSVTIENTSGAMFPLAFNDMVKVLSFSEQNEMQTFIAKSYYSTPEFIKLFSATVIKTVNNRKHLRVPTKLEAVLYLENEKFPIKILDISVGGVLIESEQILKLGEVVQAEFIIQNNLLAEPCKVMRIIKQTGALYSYGVQFLSIDDSNSSKICTYVFNKQIAERQKLI